MISKCKIKRIAIPLGFLTLILLQNYILLSNEVLNVTGDGLGYFVNKKYMADALKEGTVPLWNPFSAIGMPFLADVQQSIFNPFNFLFLILEAPLAFNILRIVQLFIATYFMYLFTNEMLHSETSAIITGVAFGFSVMMGGTRVEHHTIINTIACFPAIMFLVEKYKNTQYEKWLMLSVLPMAIQFFCGFTQIVIYFDVFVLTYVFFVCCEEQPLKGRITACLKWGGLYVFLISVQLIPTLMLMVQSGRSQVSWDFFSAYSYNWKILLMCFFPMVYFNRYEPFSAWESSELSIEIYIGILCLIYIIYTVRYCFKEKNVRYFLTVAIIAFLYGMAPRLPVVGNIIYHIPILGSFRCASRVLPLFVFAMLILFAIGIRDIKERDALDKIIFINILVLLMEVMIFLVIIAQYSQVQLSEEVFADYRKSIITYMPYVVGVLGIHLACLYVLKYKRGMVIGALCFFMIGVMVFGDLIYFSDSLARGVYPVEDLLDNCMSPEIEQAVYGDTRAGYRSFFVNVDWTTNANQNFRITNASRNLWDKLSVYNSYATFYDGKMKYWGIDGALFYPQMSVFINGRPDLLSMLGIRHIIGRNDLKNIAVVNSDELEIVVTQSENIVMLAEPVSVYGESAPWYETDTIYEVTIEVASGEIAEASYVDLIGDGYDPANLNANIFPLGNHKYRAILSTIGAEYHDNMQFRIVGLDLPDDLFIKRIDIKKKGLINEYYKEKSAGDSQLVMYENPNARPLFYVPDQIVSIESFRRCAMEDIDKINYIEDYGKNLDLTGGQTVISQVTKGINKMSAIVTTDTDTFVNMVQLSYPGWKAYVDGKQVTCYTVNNLIQGIEVPVGEHEIEFVFDPMDVKLGAMISLVGVVLSVVWCNRIKRRGDRQ